LHFGTPSISGTGKVRDFKLGTQIDRHTLKPRNAKVGQEGRGLRNVTYFYNFWTPSVCGGL